MSHRLSIDGPCVEVVDHDGRYRWRVLGASGADLEWSKDDWDTAATARKHGSEAHPELPMVADPEA